MSLPWAVSFVTFLTLLRRLRDDIWHDIFLQVPERFSVLSSRKDIVTCIQVYDVPCWTTVGFPKHVVANHVRVNAISRSGIAFHDKRLLGREQESRMAMSLSLVACTGRRIRAQVRRFRNIKAN